MAGSVITGRAAAGLLAAAMLAGCNADPALQAELAQERTARDLDMATGEGGTLTDLFRSGTNPEQNIGVNRFLWTASLDTLAFLPLEGADPFSGLIATGWGLASAGDPTPYRVTVLITNPALDARSLRVAAFRQQGGRAVPVADTENRQIENAILTRARQLRIAEMGR